ncbi:MAG: sigma 54-interacting transcriptional regulator [Clostridia bacterium]|jgi:PAS domain S-box-containing protein
MWTVVRTLSDRCGQCYSCVRNCPVKAVRIRHGQAEVIQERCIQCGNCVKICSRKAKEVLPGLQRAKNLVAWGNGIAILAPSFPATFPMEKGEIAGRLKGLGFREVWEVAAGAELVTQEYQKLDLNGGPYISSPCPAVINLIEKHYPSLIPYLVPIVSPAFATAHLIRSQRGMDVSIVFIGPCVAKKGELVNGPGLIDEVITFDELKEWFLEEAPMEPFERGAFDSPTASLGYLFPLRGGMLKNLFRSDDLLREEFMVVEGAEDCKEVFQALILEETRIRFVNALFCRGCIDGPGIATEDNWVKRKARILDYYRGIPLEKQAGGKKKLLNIHSDLSRTFQDRSSHLPQPDEEDIRRILTETNKFTPKDLLDCGACGYESCREKAIAVYQGIAEKEMCLPYLLAQKNRLLAAYQNELQNIRELKGDLDIIIDSSYDGIAMTDGRGRVERVNQAFLNLLGEEEGRIIGKSMEELEQEKILYPSATLLVLREKKPITFLQTLRNGKQVLATGTPVFDEQGRVVKVICNIRDFEELQHIKYQLEDNRKENGDVLGQLGKTEGKQRGEIIAHSEAFSRVLDMAKWVSGVDSTLLILGESGVGKDVVARYVHQCSPRRNGPFVKINCGALPESLIESELFGYEMGAFTGAKRGGKPGLLELAHHGTIFLDEIGDLPLSQQAKLLQVLQEKRITRIEGTRSMEVDIRVVAATNRDLAAMVREGRFRADLFYRLNVVPVRIPPLRERRDDIIPMMYHFLEKWNRKYGTHKIVSPEVKQILLEYPWPGNVRELENLMERLVVTARDEIIQPEDLPPVILKRGNDEKDRVTVKGILPLKKAIEEVEKQIILQARRRYRSTYKIAEVLEVNQSTVVRKLKKYDMDDEEEK